MKTSFAIATTMVLLSACSKETGSSQVASTEPSRELTNAAENYRCWTNGSINGVVKIDVVNKLICQTGFGGQDYSCPNPKLPQLAMKIDSVTREQRDFFGTPTFATTYKASTAENTEHATITIYEQDFPRPDFPNLNQKVHPANLEVSSSRLGFAPYQWTRKPNGTFEDSDFFCLSEKYFLNADSEVK